jgi:melanoma-associated antigen p97
LTLLPRLLLQGQGSCHTGYRKTSGWTLPVGYMTSKNIMPVVSSNADVTDDAETVS